MSQTLEDALASLGVEVRGVIPPDGAIHRYNCLKKKKKNGWAVKFPDGTAGKYGLWGATDDDGVLWNDGTEITPERRLYFEAQNQKFKEQRVNEQLEVAAESLKKWEAINDTGTSEYLSVKKIKKHGVKIDVDGVLYIPIRDEKGKLWSLQRITEKDKYFEYKGKIKGCFHTIYGNTERTILCEGYATGATIHEATGYRVIVCLNADNMKAVAPFFKSAQGVIVAADNDISSKGENTAKDIRKLYGINYVMPATIGTDFNDCENVASYFVQMIKVFSIEHYLNDETLTPTDLISPRILVPNGLCLFGGAPKVGKSDFVLSWLMHMAAGVEFMGMTPARPLKIFYLQAEIGYFYIRERIENVDISPEALEIAKKNMLITPRLQQILDADGVAKVGNTIRATGGCDIIAIDPLRNLYDGDSENDNTQMLSFLKNRIEALRPYSDNECGIITVHHTKKVAKDELAADPFLAFSGASSLRGFYNTGIMMYRPDEDESERVLAFELRDGKPIDKIHADKQNGRWYQIHKEKETHIPDERHKKLMCIADEVKICAERGEFYTRRAFSDLYAGRLNLGSSITINRLLGEMIAQSHLSLGAGGILIR